MSLRIHITGIAGGGKTTLGVGLAERLGIPLTSLDAIAGAWGWGAQERPNMPVEERESRVEQILSGPKGWVIEGGYLWWTSAAYEQADALIWLDVAPGTALRRALFRTVSDYLGRIEAGRGRSRFQALIHPNLRSYIQIVRTELAERRARPNLVADAEGRPLPPGGDKDENSRASLERHFQCYQAKAIRFTRTPTLDEVLDALETKIEGFTRPDSGVA